MTPVVFKYDSNEDEVIAIFFTQKYNEKLYGDNLLNSYATIGQHSAIHKDFMELPNATSEQYKPLLDELQNHIGYKDLLIKNNN